MEHLRSKVLLAVLALAVAFGTASVAMAQVNLDLRTTPTNVIKTGQSEVMGRVILAAGAACGTNADTLCTTVAGTISVQYNGVGIDNCATTGTACFATLIAGTFTADASFRGITIGTNRAGLLGATTTFSVSNTTSGGVVSFTTLATIDLAVGDNIFVDGVRGRIQLNGLLNTAAGSPGSDVEAFLTATPSTTASFAPTSEVVARSADGLVVAVASSTCLQCTGTCTGTATVTLTEGFNGAFVQHITAADGAPTAPADQRGLFDGTAAFVTNFAGTANTRGSNTQFNIVTTAYPTGFVPTYPTTVADTGPGLVSTIERLASGLTATNVTYEFTTTAQGTSDTSIEVFPVIPVLTFTAPGALGSNTAQARLYPPLLTTGEATTITSAPILSPVTTTAPLGARPRFNDPLKPSPAGAFLSVVPCRTNLLWPFVVQDRNTANTARTNFLTGLALANTGSDFPAFASTVCGGTDCGALDPPAGSCRWYAFQQWSTHVATSGASGAGPAPAVITITRGPISAGDTDLLTADTVVGNTATIWQGYMITVCDFQFAHGFAFIAQLQDPTFTVSHGYLALIIPDPIVQGGRVANNVDFAAAQSGEGLTQ